MNYYADFSKLTDDELAALKAEMQKPGDIVAVDPIRDGWANYEQYAAARKKAYDHASLLECLKATTRSFLARTGIPPQMMPPSDYAQRAAETKAAHIANAPGAAAPKTKAAHKCPGCARKIPDNKKHCGRPKCWDLVEGDTSVDADALKDSLDAMHRQRGCSPFSLGWNWKDPA